MNREEAIAVFDEIKVNYEADPDWGVYDGVFSRRNLTEILDAYAALCVPQPDPITRLVPCGGRKAMLYCTVGEGFWVACSGVSQANRYETEAFAIKAWNESMGYTAPPRPGAIGPDAGEMAPNGDGGAEE